MLTGRAAAAGGHLVTTSAQRLLDAELGAGLRALLDDDAVTNVHLNADGSVFYRTRRGDRRADFNLAAERRLALLRTVASLAGMSITDRRPCLECRMERYDLRVSGAIPPTVPAPIVVLRKTTRRVLTLDDYVRQGALDEAAASYLASAMVAERTVVIAGPSDSGKTTLANALIAALEAVRPDLRIVCIEENVRELRIASANAVRFLAHGSVSAQDLLRFALRVNPARLFIGEARGPECYQWLRACNTGHPGGLLTLHANDARTVVERIADMVAEAGVEPSLARIARTIDLIVYIESDEALGRRVVREVLEVDYIDQRLCFRSPL